MKSNSSIVILFIVTVFCLSYNLFEEGAMGNESIYEEIINSARLNHWKLAKIQEKDNDTREVLVHSFKDDRTINIYSGHVGELDTSAVISPDGKKVAFWFRGTPSANILYISDIDTHSLKKIAEITEGFGVSWKSDSRTIIFTGALTKEDSAEFKHSLFTIDIQTGKVEPLAIDGIDYITSQSFSPDDSKIVYVKSSYKRNYIFVYDFNEKKALQLDEGENPVWSPGGQKIAYLDNENGITIISPDGRNKSKLIKSDVVSESESMRGMIMGPIYWLPDGNHLFYTKCLAEQCEIGSPYLIEVFTKESQEIPQDDWVLGSWSRQ